MAMQSPIVRLARAERDLANAERRLEIRETRTLDHLSPGERTDEQAKTEALRIRVTRLRARVAVRADAVAWAEERSKV